MEIKIDKDIPAPSKKNHHSTKYPFAQCDVGNSFFVAGVLMHHVSGASRNYRPNKFTCRTVTENGIKGVRVWRIA